MDRKGTRKNQVVDLGKTSSMGRSKAGKRLFLAMGILLFVLNGCGGEQQGKPVPIQAQDISEEHAMENNGPAQAEYVVALYQDIYDEAVGTGNPGELEVMERIVERFGEEGYAAVDERNQVNMTEPEQVMRFCSLVDAKDEGSLTILVMIYSGGFIKYDLHTADGEVNITRSDYQYVNGNLKNLSNVSYQASFWQYTQEGYLLFEGDYFSESYYALLLSDVSEHAALRVQPLDKACRELNRQYILPVGYERNNLFLTEWSEDDFGELDFYDLFDQLYPNVYGKPAYYPAANHASFGAVCQIPADLFETVIQEYFRIDSRELQAKTTYIPENNAYEYRPRGLYEAEYPDIPYPEVEGCTENSDGTITLFVNAVYPEDNTSRAYAHQVVIRPLSDGHFQYVSNHMVPEGNSYDAWWHSERLTEDQWKETYESSENGALQEQWEKGYDLPIENGEKEAAEDDCKAAMELIAEIYRQADKGEASNVVISDHVILQMKDKVKAMGNPVTGSEVYAVMENYEEMENFLLNAEDGKTGEVILFRVRGNGGIRRLKFIYDGTDMYVLAANAAWNERGIPMFPYISYTRIKKWKYTEKGYFCYELCVPEPPEVTEIVDGSCLVRVKPLDPECREMSVQCVLPLGYQGNNLLCSNWDRDNLENLDYNGMYEYLYTMKFGGWLDREKCSSGIPKVEFENTIMEYLPVSSEQIREWAVFDEAYQTYLWEPLGCGNYAPTFFGTSIPEVTRVRKNEDGTVTLTVDAVCQMILCNDAVITHELTVKFSEDGSFQYLGNRILNHGIENIPEYQYRIDRKP